MSSREDLLTPQQARAISTRGDSVVLSSGAGCGKTHVLTERYLAHLREGAEVSQIVAITFTDRAARQMRGRIRAAITAHLRAASDAEAEAWARHLRAMETAAICTIHAFCGTLLRQHAAEAGLDPSFEVLEEVLAVNLRRDAIADALERLLVSKSAASDDLRELVLLFGWRAIPETVEGLLHDFDAAPWRDWSVRPAAEIAADWLAFAQDELLPRHLTRWLASRPVVGDTLALLQRHPPLPGPMSEPVATLLRETPLLPQTRDLAAAVKRLTEAAKVGRVGAKAWPDSAVYEAVKSSFEAFREDLRKLEPERLAGDVEEVSVGVAVGQRWLRVASATMDAYRERKRQHGVVDFQDLLLRARDLLRDCPEVRASLQERYQHLLIDELQDTDPVQMSLVEALTGGGLTGGKLFAVGDHKQSIYRFRGADVSLFQGLRGRVPLKGRQTLSVNFRSQPAILDFVNALCGEALEDYEPLTAHQPQRNAGPCVEFLWSARPENASVGEARAAEADLIARRLAGMIGAEQLVTDGEGLRPVRAGDVVLLFRAMSNVHLYEAALRRHGLDYYLVGGRAFFAQQEVHDILNLLRALENPQDAVSLAGTLRSPLCGVSDEALFVLAGHRQGLWAAILDEHTRTLLPRDQLPRVVRAAGNLAAWRAQKDRLTIAQLLERIVAEAGYDAAILMEHLGERKLANLWKLVDLARTFDRSGLFGLAEFIARLGDLVSGQPREEQAATQPESADVVRLMSIHQAKGLEFPIVVLPDIAARGGSAYSPAARWHRRLGCVARPPSDEDGPPFPEFGARLLRALDEVEEWDEELRTLYVACTRPRDYLVLSAALEDDYQPEGAWMQTLGRRFDLRTGACLAAVERVPVVHIHEEQSLPCRRGASVPASSHEAPPPVPALSVASRCRSVTMKEIERHRRKAVSLFADDVDEVGDALRFVLARWLFADPDGWRAQIRRYPALTAELSPILERFARSALRKRLAAARLRRSLPFMLHLDPARSSPAVEGSIDCMWQDGDGWRLAAWVTRPDDEEAARMSLTLAREALRRQGTEVCGCVVVRLPRGEMVECAPEPRLDEVVALLRQMTMT